MALLEGTFLMSFQGKTLKHPKTIYIILPHRSPLPPIPPPTMLYTSLPELLSDSKLCLISPPSLAPLSEIAEAVSVTPQDIETIVRSLSSSSPPSPSSS